MHRDCVSSAARTHGRVGAEPRAILSARTGCCWVELPLHGGWQVDRSCGWRDGPMELADSPMASLHMQVVGALPPVDSGPVETIETLPPSARLRVKREALEEAL